MLRPPLDDLSILQFFTTPGTVFDGFVFIGSDYISGQQGALAYSRDTGRIIPSGEDGCYLSLRKTAEGHQIGVDYCGYKKIYYYNDGEVWAISEFSDPLSGAYARKRDPDASQ